MKIVVTGASGLVGSALLPALAAAGHDIVPVSWRGASDLPPSAHGADAVISLAGENIAQRWTPAVRLSVRDSRAGGTARLIRALEMTPRLPKIFVSASATGYYGDRGDEVLTELSSPGTGFLAEICREWEKAADSAGALGMRVVKLRFGIVLDPRRGALGKMLPAFRAGLGARLGSGSQWLPWIHRRDLTSLIVAALEDKFAGVFNACAPEPVRNCDYTRALGAALRRPAVLRIPAFALRAMLGEMSEMLLGSQRAIPQSAQSAGFQFEFPEIGAALRNLL